MKIEEVMSSKTPSSTVSSLRKRQIQSAIKLSQKLKDTPKDFYFKDTNCLTEQEPAEATITSPKNETQKTQRATTAVQSRRKTRDIMRVVGFFQNPIDKETKGGLNTSSSQFLCHLEQQLAVDRLNG